MSDDVRAAVEYLRGVAAHRDLLTLGHVGYVSAPDALACLTDRLAALEAALARVAAAEGTNWANPHILLGYYVSPEVMAEVKALLAPPAPEAQ